MNYESIRIVLAALAGLLWLGPRGVLAAPEETVARGESLVSAAREESLATAQEKPLAVTVRQADERAGQAAGEFRKELSLVITGAVLGAVLGFGVSELRRALSDNRRRRSIGVKPFLS